MLSHVLLPRLSEECRRPLCSLAGCASTHFENTSLAAGQINDERRTVDDSHADRPLILLAVSGGGSRAAALGWAVLRELNGFRYTARGQSRSLIDDVGVVSSVSGGSVIAADFALYGPQGLDRFASDFLLPDNMRTLAINSLNPLNWLKLAITGSSRIDMVESLFDKELFKEKTFSELNQPDKVGSPRELLPEAPTDPDVRISRIRPFGPRLRYVTGEVLRRGCGSGYRSSTRFIHARCERRLNHTRHAPMTRRPKL